MRLNQALFFALLAQGSLVLGGALTHVLVGRALGAEHYGTFSVLYTLVFIFSVIFSLGLDQAIYAEVREIASQQSKIGKISVAGLVGSLIAALLGASFSVSLVPVLVPSAEGLSMWVALWVTGSIVLKYNIEVMRILDRVDLSSLIGSPQRGGLLIYGTSTLVASLVASGTIGVPKDALLTEVVALMALATSVVALVSLGALAVLVLRLSGSPTKLHVDLGELFALIKRGVLLTGANFASTLRRQLDIILVWLVVGPSATGVYSSALRLAALAYVPIAVMNLALPGKLVKVLTPRENGGGTETALRKVEAGVKPLVGISVFLVSVLLAIFALWGGEILSLLFGAEYKSGELILIILTIGQLVNVAFGPAVVVLTVLKQDRVLLGATVVGLLFQATVGYVGARYFGYYWVATAAGIALFVQNMILTIALCRRSLVVSILGPLLLGCKNAVR